MRFEHPTARAFPFADDLVERAERLLERRDAVGAVVVVEIHVVGAEPLERRVDRLPRVLGGAAKLSTVRLPAELRREHDLVSPALEDLAEEALAVAVAVDVGGVEERDALGERGVHDLARAGKVHLPAEVVAAEPDDGHGEIGGAEVPVLDRASLSARPTRPGGRALRCQPWLSPRTGSTR